MTKTEMLKKIKELFKTLDELADYSLYSHKELLEFKNQTLENFNIIWDI